MKKSINLSLLKTFMNLFLSFSIEKLNASELKPINDGILKPKQVKIKEVTLTCFMCNTSVTEKISDYI